MKSTEYEEEQGSRTVKIIWLIIRIVLSLGLIVMLGWLTLRSCYQDGTKKIKKYMWTEASSAQYENGGVSVYRLTEYNDPDLSRLFYIGRIYYTEEISQFQFMLRYNVESDEYKDISDSKAGVVKSDGESGFIFELTDKNGNHYTSYTLMTDSAMMYRYVRLAFENVDISNAEELQVNIYYRSSNGDKSNIGSCIVWQKDAPHQEYKLSKNDTKAAKPTNGTVVYSWNEDGK